MGLRPAVSVPQIGPAEMELMIARAGLVLNPGQIADLVLAWRQIVQLTALIPRDRAPADDLAFAFHLPPAKPGKRIRAPQSRSVKPAAIRVRAAEKPAAKRRKPKPRAAPAARKPAPKRR